MIYTDGVTDIDYHQPVFGYLLVLAEGLYLLKFPHLNLAYSANRFKEITTPAFIEAGLNIVISLILIRKYGLIGVAIGTVVAMIYRMIFQVYYTSRIVPDRKQWIFYRKLIIFSLTTIVACCICLAILPRIEYSVINWIIAAVVYSMILGVVFLFLSICLFKNEMKYFVNYLRRKKTRRG